MTQTRPSKQEINNEFKKCGMDPVYFIETYAKIQDRSKGLVPFKLHPFQRDAIHDFLKYDNIIALKSRQIGFSTLVGAYCAWILFTKGEKNIITVATQQAVAYAIAEKALVVLTNLPDWLQEINPIKKSNKDKIEMTRGSAIKAFPTKSKRARSEAASLLIIDEAAHVEGLGGDDGLWTAIRPILTTSRGKCIALSTPNGAQGWFYETYSAAESGDNNFHPIKLDWKVYPGRDQAWYEKERREMPSKTQFAQEYECSFLASGATFFDVELIERIAKGIKEPKLKAMMDNGLWVWEENKENERYFICADVASGGGTDYSTAHVISSDGTIVAEYKGKQRERDFANILEQIGRTYNYADIVVEQNASGPAVSDQLENLEYPNLIYTKKEGNSVRICEKYESEQNPNVKKGVITDSTSRPLMLANLNILLTDGTIKIKSKRLLDELRTFIVHNNKPQAKKGANDDLIMALAIGTFVRKFSDVKRKSEVDFITSLMTTGVKVKNTVLNTTPAGFISPQQLNIHDAGPRYDKKHGMYVTSYDSWLLERKPQEAQPEEPKKLTINDIVKKYGGIPRVR